MSSRLSGYEDVVVGEGAKVPPEEVGPSAGDASPNGEHGSREDLVPGEDGPLRVTGQEDLERLIILLPGGLSL